MTYYQKLFTDGIVNPAPDDQPGAARSAFVDGSVPMLVAGPERDRLDRARPAAATPSRTSSASPPCPKETSSTSFVGGSNLVVFKKSEEPGHRLEVRPVALRARRSR